MAVKLIAFDLDGTLAPSKGPISFEMSRALGDLLDVAQVCIVTGGSETQIISQVVDRLPDKVNLRNLHLMPTSGGVYLKRHFGAWKPVYSIELKKEQSKRIQKSLRLSAELLGFWPKEPYGRVIEDRGCQVTFSALGQKAPEELKAKWDKDGSKKRILRNTVAELLPEFEVRSGGSTSIDVTKVGVDKGFAIRELSVRASIPLENISFVGDRLDVGGNDYPVLSTGADCQSVAGPAETLQLIRKLLQTI